MEQELDLDTPSPARVYDYFLGGSHNFEADRRMARELEQAMPDIGEIMRANRSFLRRAVRYLVAAGVRQFLDLGSGIPTVGNVHEIALRAAPDARVVYVDIDSVAVAHSHSILDGDPRCTVVRADLRDADQVLDDPGLTGVLNLTEPVAVLMLGVLHQLPGDDPATTIARYREATVAGSYLALSHASQDERPEETEVFKKTYDRGYRGPQMNLRTRAEVLRLFDGYDLVDPGLVHLPAWHPDSTAETTDRPERYSTYAGVGRRR